MRVLHITSKPMIPSIDGGTMASKSLYDTLISQGFHVDYATCFSDKHPLKTEEIERENISLVGSFKVDLQVKLKGSLKALLQNQSYHVARFISPDFSEFIEFHSDEYDVLLFDGLFSTTPLLRGKLNHRSQFWLRSHNLEHQIWQEEANLAKNPLKKNYLKLLAKQLASYENFIATRMDGVLTIRENDIKHYRELGLPAYFLPSFSGRANQLDELKPSFYFLGAMNWKPNQEAAKTVVGEIFPSIQKEIPEAELHLAGSFMEEMKFDQQNFIQHGFVENLEDFYAKTSILIAPIETGSGVKIKVLEALKRGKIVLSSIKGAEGLSTSDYPNLIICKRSKDYVHFAKLLLEKGDFYVHILQKIEALSSKKEAHLDLKTIFAPDENGE